MVPQNCIERFLVSAFQMCRFDAVYYWSLTNTDIKEWKVLILICQQLSTHFPCNDPLNVVIKHLTRNKDVYERQENLQLNNRLCSPEWHQCAETVNISGHLITINDPKHFSFAFRSLKKVFISVHIGQHICWFSYVCDTPLWANR